MAHLINHPGFQGWTRSAWAVKTPGSDKQVQIGNRQGFRAGDEQIINCLLHFIHGFAWFNCLSRNSENLKLAQK